MFDDLAGTRADLLDGSIGELSMFHETFGYYAQGVVETTVVLPSGWRERLVRFETPATNGVVAWCLEPGPGSVRPPPRSGADPASVTLRHPVLRTIRGRRDAVAENCGAQRSGRRSKGLTERRVRQVSKQWTPYTRKMSLAVIRSTSERPPICSRAQTA